MINSLRLQGHAEPIHVLDCGLTPEPARAAVAAKRPSPTLRRYAPVPAQDGRAATAARRGDGADRRRHDRHPAAARADREGRRQPRRGVRERPRPLRPRLGRAPRPRPDPAAARTSPPASCSSAGRPAPRVLRLLDDRQRRWTSPAPRTAAGTTDYPFTLSRAGRAQRDPLRRGPIPERVVALDRRLAATPPFRDLRANDVDTLRCAYPDGTEPYVLHQYVRKPWLERDVPRHLPAAAGAAAARRRRRDPGPRERGPAADAKRAARPDRRARSPTPWTSARWYLTEVVPRAPARRCAAGAAGEDAR